GHRERLRQRFAASAASLGDEQKLELLLTFGIPRRDVAPIASELMRRFGTIARVLAAREQELLEVDGIGDHAATLLRLVGALREHKESLPVEKPRPITPPAELFVDIASKTTPTPTPARSAREILEPAKPVAAVAPEPRQLVRRTRTGLFSACVFRDALKLIHKIPLGSTIDQAREFLQTQGLHYSGASTRHRYASYIVNRVFPLGAVDQAICRFARAFEGTQALRDVVAFRHMIAEPLARDIVVELLLPAIGRQNVPRTQLRKFLSHRFPGAKPNSINSCGKAIVEIIGESQLVGATRTDLAIHFRPVDLRSFGFILHSEFPEPGMHRLDELESSAAFRAMLWTKEDMKTALYELRNKGLISKISEIDSFRQFTTRFSLSQAVEKLIAIGDPR
ncbi:MAG: hypothetical protein K2X36_05105, partial [Microbacteriaceae bacterium]|nr:hypothetical protein [Microbacteriaceae bacterium]